VEKWRKRKLLLLNVRKIMVSPSFLNAHLRQPLLGEHLGNLRQHLLATELIAAKRRSKYSLEDENGGRSPAPV
jgi:hypothetical protein